jgi:hypothetical protein
MIKISLFFILFFSVQSLSAQRNNDTVVTISVGLGIDKVKERQKKIKCFADSINNYKGGVLPTFLFNECFDLESNLWNGLHSAVSLRWNVLKKVSNKEALKKILASHDKRLKRKCNYDKSANPLIEVPLIRKSFYDLIQIKLSQLKHTSNAGSRRR